MKTLSLPTTMLCLALAGQVFGAKVIPNHAIADLVLGQSDFTSGSFVSPYTSFRMSFPSAVVVDPITRKVFVCDLDGDRILRFSSVSALDNGAPAEAVFGQASFSTQSDSGGATGLYDPQAMIFDRFGRLWVADSGNNRVLVFEAASFRANQPTADLVFGQPDFATVTSAAAANKMSFPCGMWIDTNDNLWVADTGNNRVLRFAAISTKSSGASANVVLGQTLFTTSVAGSGTTGLQTPESVTVSSGGTLFVACRNGNRVMRFNNAATLVNNSPATAVLGQADFSTVTTGLSADKFNTPRGVFLTLDDSLWVSDTSNNRMLRFSKASTKATGSAADGVVGQPDFITNTAATTNRSLKSSRHQSFVDASGSLWLADTGNNRVLRFPADVTQPKLTVTTKVPKTVTKKKLTIKGTASDTYGISKVQYMVGDGPLKTATGTTSWQFSTSLDTGKNQITIFATDSVGNKSTSKVIKVKRAANNSPALLLSAGD